MLTVMCARVVRVQQNSYPTRTRRLAFVPVPVPDPPGTGTGTASVPVPVPVYPLPDVRVIHYDKTYIHHYASSKLYYISYFHLNVPIR